MAPSAVAIDLARSAERIERDIETLAGSDYTRSDEAIRRYAYTQEYRNTLDYFARELREIGFDVSEDPVGTLVARNRPRGENAFGIGSHCDSNRNGGKYDGTMGVVTALEVCRLNAELELDLPLQLISFLEGEAADPDATEQARRRVEEHLAAAAAEARRTGPVTVRVASGRTLKKAAQDVDWAPGGLLLIGSSRLAQGRQTFLGTTAARLLKHVPVPMVVVPRPARTEEN